MHQFYIINQINNIPSLRKPKCSCIIYFEKKDPILNILHIIDSFWRAAAHRIKPLHCCLAPALLPQCSCPCTLGSGQHALPQPAHDVFVCSFRTISVTIRFKGGLMSMLNLSKFFTLTQILKTYLPNHYPEYYPTRTLQREKMLRIVICTVC